MATRGSAPDALVDTSVAVALVVGDHQQHEATTQALGDRVLGLAGHAVFETFLVLTCLAPPARRSPATVMALMTANFPESRFLSPGRASALLVQLVASGVAGGSVYDALVGSAAAEHGIVLVTRDRRALGTYRALDVEVELLVDR
ncbi:MAG: type II toxin-antitoxin system VapC family toxin [Acidimicrobiales bacterium]